MSSDSTDPFPKEFVSTTESSTYELHPLNQSSLSNLESATSSAPISMAKALLKSIPRSFKVVPLNLEPQSSRSIISDGQLSLHNLPNFQSKCVLLPILK